LSSSGARLAEGLAVVAVGQGVVVEGGKRRLRFTDPISTRLLLDKSLLDGRWNEQEIAAAAGLDLRGVRAVLRVLRERGVVRTGPEDAGGELGVYVRRMYPTEVAGGLLDQLARARVGVRGEGFLAGTVAMLLERSGVGQVCRLVGAFADHAFDLTVVTDGGAPPVGAPSLPVVASRDVGEIGPLLGTPGGRCPACCAPAGTGGGEDPAVAMMAAGIAVAGSLSFLGRYGDSPLWTGRVRVRPVDGTVEEVPVGCRPDCRLCGRADLLELDGDALAALDYEQSVEVPFAGGQLDPITSRPRPRSKLYLDVPRLSLRRRLPPGPDGTDHNLMLALLRTISVGPRRTRAVGAAAGDAGRLVPSVADAGSVATFVMPSRQAHAFGAGAYVDVDRQDLVFLRHEAPGARDPVRTVTLALVGNLREAVTRFGAPGRRIMFQDGGFLLGHVVEQAIGLGLTCSLVVDWAAADVRRELELPSWDAPMALIRLDSAGGDRELIPALPPGIRYAFGPGQLDDQTLATVVSAAHAGLAKVVGDQAERLEVVVLTRRAGGPRIRHVSVDEGRLMDSPGAGTAARRLDDFLRRCGLAVPATVVVACDLRQVLATAGADGYQAALVSAAALANLIRLEAGRHGLSGGLFSRLPATALFSRTSALDGGPRLLAGVGLGEAPTLRTAAGSSESAVTW
jgi:hypothetical protein